MSVTRLISLVKQNKGHFNNFKEKFRRKDSEHILETKEESNHCIGSLHLNLGVKIFKL